MAMQYKSASVRSDITQEEREKLEFHERATMSGAMIVYDIPEDLNDGAKEWYRFLVDNLKQSSIMICDLDVVKLKSAAVCAAMLDECNRELADQPLVVVRTSARGIEEPIENPFFKVRDKLMKEWAMHCKGFGLDPQSRVQFAGNQIKNVENEADPLLSIING